VFGSLSLSKALTPTPRDARLTTATNSSASGFGITAPKTLFGIEDEVVECWLTEYIQMIEWRVDEVTTTRQRSHKGSSLADRRLTARAARLGALWTDDEEAQLREEHASGMNLDEMANVHDRNVGGIRSRLIRLGLESGDRASSGKQ
jgi:hypothetical protein